MLDFCYVLYASVFVHIFFFLLVSIWVFSTYVISISLILSSALCNLLLKASIPLLTFLVLYCIFYFDFFVIQYFFIQTWTSCGLDRKSVV